MRRAHFVDQLKLTVIWIQKPRLTCGASSAVTLGGKRMWGHEGEMRNLRIRRSSSIPAVEGWTLPGRPTGRVDL